VVCFEAVVKIFGRVAWFFSFWVWDGRKIAGVVAMSETADGFIIWDGNTGACGLMVYIALLT
jgi:hypothetical protein